jgi:peptide/nickel transport system substrate-binding protein
VLDKYRIKLQTKTPFSVLIFAMREMFMMSPKAVRELGKGVASKPIGTGPFIVKEWVPNEKHILEANPNYHGPKPKVKTLIWRPVPEPSTRIVELRAGTADIIDKLPPELAEGLSDEKLQVIRKRSVYRMAVKLNCSKPPFDKVKARQALNYATDKEALVMYVLRGAGYVTAGYLGPHLGGYNPTLKPYPHDPALAKKLLAEAGYPNGVDIELVSPAGRYLKDKEVMEAVAYQVKEAGFNMKVKVLEWGMFLKEYNNSNGYFIGSGYNDPQSDFTEDGDSRVKGYSWVFYHNDEFNRLLDKAKETFDVKQRDAIYQSLSKMFWDDATNLWLYHAQDIYGVNTRVKNFSPRADALILLQDAYLG